MPTIKELVDKHSKVPGDIRVIHPDFNTGVWLRPYFHCELNKCWYGRNEVGNAMVVCDSLSPNFQLYEEPKPKVKRAQYLIVEGEGRYHNPYTTADWYKDEDDARLGTSVFGHGQFIRLTETERDFDR